MRYLWILILCSTAFTQCLGDMNEDGDKNVLDVVLLVNDILAGDDADCVASICTGLTEVELWGEWYDIESTTHIYSNSQGLTGSIPPEIGCLTNLTELLLDDNQLTGEIPSEIGQLTKLEDMNLSYNQLTGEIPQKVCDLIESNNLWIPNILDGNPDLINTCE